MRVLNNLCYPLVTFVRQRVRPLSGWMGDEMNETQVWDIQPTHGIISSTIVRDYSLQGAIIT